MIYCNQKGKLYILTMVTGMIFVESQTTSFEMDIDTIARMIGAGILIEIGKL